MGTGIDAGATALKAVRIAPGSPATLLAARVYRRDSAASDSTDSAFTGIPKSAFRDLAGSGLARLPVIAVTGRDVMVRVLVTPPMDATQLDRHIQVEMLDKLGTEDNAFVVDHHVLPVSPIYLSKRVLTFTAAMRESALVSTFDSWRTRGVMPDSFAPASEALYHAFRLVFAEHNKTTLVLDIGADHTEMALVREGDLLLARMVPVGGNKITATLAKRLGFSVEKAEEYKIERARVQFDNRGLEKSMLQINAALRENVEGLAGLASNAVAFIRKEIRKRDLDFDDIALTGGGCRLNGLTEFFKSKFQKPAYTFSAGDGLDTSKADPESVRIIETHGLSMAVPIGLALMQHADYPPPIRLLPPKTARAREFKKRTVWGIAAGAATILAATILVSRASTAARRADEIKSAFIAGKAKLDDTRAKLDAENKRVAYSTWMANQYAARGGAARAYLEVYNHFSDYAQIIFPGNRLKIREFTLAKPGETIPSPDSESIPAVRTLTITLILNSNRPDTGEPDSGDLNVRATGDDRTASESDYTISPGDLAKLEELKSRLKNDPILNGDAVFNHDAESGGIRVEFTMTVKEKMPVIQSEEVL